MGNDDRSSRSVAARRPRLFTRRYARRPPARYAPAPGRRTLAPSPLASEPISLALAVAEVREALEVAALATFLSAALMSGALLWLLKPGRRASA